MSGARKDRGAGKIIYGGSFNPIHIAHLRLAIQTLEMLGGLAGSLDFVPVGNPPHKKAETLLPFPLRAKMIRGVIKDKPRLACNDLEGRRPGASYTFDTLRNYLQYYKEKDLYFLLGSQDYALLPQWRRGLELPALCNLVIAPRGGFSPADFMDLTRQFWPEAKEDAESIQALGYAGTESFCMRLGDTKIYYLPLPFLPISASLIRDLWLSGRNVDYLMPESALTILEEEKETALACWQRKDYAS